LYLLSYSFGFLLIYNYKIFPRDPYFSTKESFSNSHVANDMILYNNQQSDTNYKLYTKL